MHGGATLTIKELAKIAGLNHSTISRSLNDSPLISDETKQRVLKLAEQHNFELNASARGMRTKKTGTIGVYSLKWRIVIVISSISAV